MARRLRSSRAHADRFVVPTEPDALIRHYLLSGDDIDLIRTIGLVGHFIVPF